MQFDLQKTIVAIGTGPTAARRAVVRLSGVMTGEILSRLIFQPDAAEAVERLLSTSKPTALKTAIRSGWNARTCPADVYYWPDTRSYTGEPCAEVHMLGSPPLVESIVEQILAFGARLAERGEFTLRSFLAGKLDLTQAEAVLGVIEANSSDQLATALRQLSGNLSEPVRILRNQLLELVAHLEAGLDFVEEDIEFISSAELRLGLCGIADRLRQIAAQLQTRGTRSRLPRVVLTGLPNAGKSTLFNALLDSDRSIVSTKAGTTRDSVVANMRCGEAIIELVDTAGTELAHENSPRAQAQQVLKEQLRLADLIVLCVDASDPPSTQWIADRMSELANSAQCTMLCGTKADLINSDRQLDLWPHLVSSAEPVSVQSLRQSLQQNLAQSPTPWHTSALQGTAIRCSHAVQLALSAIEAAILQGDQPDTEDFVAAELRYALEELSGIMGETHTEDILGEIFSRFCIGK